MKVACGRCWDRDCKCSAQELKEWSTVEEKMYSRDVFDKILKECYQGGVDGVSWEEIAKRIKENL